MIDLPTQDARATCPLLVREPTNWCITATAAICHIATELPRNKQHQKKDRLAAVNLIYIYGMVRRQEMQLYASCGSP